MILMRIATFLVAQKSFWNAISESVHWEQGLLESLMESTFCTELEKGRSSLVSLMALIRLVSACGSLPSICVYSTFITPLTKMPR